MTEQEWRQCENVEVMLSSLGGKATERKTRLFAVACTRRIWHLLSDGWAKEAVELAERFADGRATEQERENAHAIGLERPVDWEENEPLAAALGTLAKANPQYDGPTPLFAGAFATATAAASALADAGSNGRRGSPAWQVELERAEQSQLAMLRDIFGPTPFRPIAIDPSLLTTTVVKLANAIYSERAWDRVPVLGDSLEEAGCTNQEVLQHCRRPGPHVRGCWVVDLVLKKE
ncbi:hypothetical protein AYO40_01750 [Planctomycetaceae bacterium SCGC AG-212-D15]|nr:hypothetical protein AYO40_01750 [Planctomycetaceae bacterium SCGC AG-212-D15]